MSFAMSFCIVLIKKSTALNFSTKDISIAHIIFISIKYNRPIITNKGIIYVHILCEFNFYFTIEILTILYFFFF